MAHQRESLTGAGVEADRRDSLLFHFISFFPLFFLCFLFETRRTDDAAELAERKRRRERGRTTTAAAARAPTATKGSAMRQGEIVQCQGYMGARAQNRPYAEVRQGGSGQEEGKRRRRWRRARKREDQLALAGCSPVGIRCISCLHLADENIMPIACVARGLQCKRAEFIWTRTAASEITARNTVLYSRNT